MENIDWTKFTTRISINATKKKIFDQFMTQDNLEQWFLSSAIFYLSNEEVRERKTEIEKGDSYRWMWHGSDDVAKGEVLEKRDNYLKFTFLACVVEVQVKEEENEKVLELTQSGIPLDEQARLNYFVGCTRGWTFYMANLKSILEGGIDLRNKNIALINVINT